VASSSSSSLRPDRQRIRLGVVGLGAVAQAVHLPLIARRSDAFELAAICDLSPSLLAAIGDRYGVPGTARHGSLEMLLDDATIDGVVLLTSGSHGDAALATLDRDLPVLCEKPLAYTLGEADRLAASANRDRLLLGYMKVFDPAVEEAARIVRDDGSTLGERRAIEVAVLHPTSASQLAFAHLLPPPRDVDPVILGSLRAATDDLVRDAIGPAIEAMGELYAGILLGSVVHELSVIRAVAGDIVAIDWADQWAATDDEPGSLLIVGRLGDGTRVHIGWHFLPGYPAYREDVRFHHVGGSVELTFPAPYRLNEPTRLRVSSGGDETRRVMTFDSIEEAFERELLAFRDLVVQGTLPRTGVADGRTDIVTSQRVIARLAERSGIEITGEAAAPPTAPAPR
jgi:predicted dehydrogenase